MSFSVALTRAPRSPSAMPDEGCASKRSSGSWLPLRLLDALRRLAPIGESSTKMRSVALISVAESGLV